MSPSPSSSTPSLGRRPPPGRGGGGGSMVARAPGARLMLIRADAGGRVGGRRVAGGGAPGRGFEICWAELGLPAPAGFFAGRLEELTPELPDLADRVRPAPTVR